MILANLVPLTMKTRIFLLLLALIGCGVCSRAQHVAIQDIHIQYTGRDSLWFADFNYPFIVSDNKQTQDSINYTIANTNLAIDSLTTIDSNSLRKILESEDNSGIVTMEYKTTLITNKLLGIDIGNEYYGMYTFNNLWHLLFDTETGKQLRLLDIVNENRKEDFSATLNAAMKDSLNNHIINLYKDVVELQIDSDEIGFIIPDITDCMTRLSEEPVINTTEFYFEQNNLVIENNCGLPNAEMVYQPYFKLIYNINKIKEFIKSEIYEQLMAQKANK